MDGNVNFHRQLLRLHHHHDQLHFGGGGGHFYHFCEMEKKEILFGQKSDQNKIMDEEEKVNFCLTNMST